MGYEESKKVKKSSDKARHERAVKMRLVTTETTTTIQSEPGTTKRSIKKHLYICRGCFLKFSYTTLNVVL